VRGASAARLPHGMQQKVVGPVPVREPVGEPGVAGQVPPVGLVTVALADVSSGELPTETHDPEVTVVSSVVQVGDAVSLKRDQVTVQD
jgi:hypothetical protein